MRGDSIVNTMVRIVIVTLVLALPGCAFTRLLTAGLEKPTFTYRGIELVEASRSRAHVIFLISAHNPNEGSLKNVTASYDLFVEGRRILTGQAIPLELGPKGDTEISVPAMIVYSDLAPVLGSVLRRIVSGRKTLPVTINAVFSGSPAIYTEAGKETPISFEKRVSKTVDIPLAQERKTRGE